MKYNKWLTAVALTGAVFCGGMAAEADSLTLSGGEVLDLGNTISVYDGERSFFGSQMHDWLIEGNPSASIEKVLVQENVFPENSAYAKEFSVLAADVLKQGKVYQVRAAANDTYYQGMVVSIALTDAQQKQLAVYQKAALEHQADTEKDTLVQTLLNACHHQVTVTSASSWDEEKAASGLAYRTGDARMIWNRDGFTLPLYMKGVVIKEDGRTTYTLLVGDQVSGQYLAPFFDAALQGAKK